MRPLVVFGYVSAEARSKTRKRMTNLAARLGQLCEIDVGVTPVSSYEKLALRVVKREVDLAWLSPIVLVSLARNKQVAPLVSLVRDTSTSYTCALIVSPTSHISTFEELHGKRAAWVDKHSAAGYVLPRIELARNGVKGSSLGDERMYGSHEGVVRAVASGRADFGATYARLDPSGMVIGPWTRTPGLAKSVRVMTTFGDVPPDAIAARYDMDKSLRERIVRGLRAMTKGWDDREIIVDVFGANDFDVPKRGAYEELRQSVYDAYKRGVLEGDEVMDATLSAAATIEARAITVKKKAPPPVPRPRAKKRSADDTA